MPSTFHYFFRNILAIAELAPFFSNVITSSRILGPVEWGHRTMGTCLMNPNWNFYVPIPGPKKLGEEETQKENWAVERLWGCALLPCCVFSQNMFSYTDMENISEPKIIIFVFVKIPPNFALPSADYQICALKKHQNVPDNMLTKPQICCGCCAYPVQFVPWL